ncbi:hypothetical protein [Streptosporangium sp. NBC_01469]|uniref:hypothetical protein n=1 Tax=Streptosporangium sp. NBC_01469 TaxID=2903898 RepID=UPI002E29A18D|nr:hypothetical protein [Streptosporangium sp. NBC_01469]
MDPVRADRHRPSARTAWILGMLPGAGSHRFPRHRVVGFSPVTVTRVGGIGDAAERPPGVVRDLPASGEEGRRR